MLKEYRTLRDIFDYSCKEYAEIQANMAMDSDAGYTYEKLRQKCETISLLLSRKGIGAADKVAIYSTGNVNWSVAYLAATAFGRIAVPILPDFSGNEAEHVLKHSEAKALFVSPKQLAKLSEEFLSTIDLVFDIESLEIIRDNTSNPTFAETCIPEEDTLATIIYTSGTTGMAKGVMLTHKNFVGNIKGAKKFFPVLSSDVFLSILPLAHAYELTLGLIYPLFGGACVCYISKTPTPTYLMRAMQAIRPTVMLSVPLIIEKVYKNTIVPMISKHKVLSWMNRKMNTTLCRIIGRKMIKTFGGRIRFFGVGGAKLDIDVERFLHKAKFPYYIGYGLTECAPLLALCGYKDTIPGQIGRAVDGMQLRLDNINPNSGEGEIVAKGDNIFVGYYKDPERTSQAFTEDGWFRTGDLASVDARGRYTIKGRIGNMIVGASGENIYPEEIEKVAKELPDIEDIIVVTRGTRLVALVKVADSLFDLHDAENDEQTKAAIESFKKTILEYVNPKVNAASQIKSVEVMKEPFKKTATMKIRRFLYKKDAPTL